MIQFYVKIRYYFRSYYENIFELEFLIYLRWLMYLTKFSEDQKIYGELVQINEHVFVDLALYCRTKLVPDKNHSKEGLTPLITVLKLIYLFNNRGFYDRKKFGQQGAQRTQNILYQSLPIKFVPEISN